VCGTLAEERPGSGDRGTPTIDRIDRIDRIDGDPKPGL